MTPRELRNRTAVFAARAARFVKPLFRDVVTKEPAGQLRRASSSTASNYRAACVARSHADFKSKLGIALEECDESAFWLEHLRDAGLVEGPELKALLQEALELSKILGASKRTADRRAEERRQRRSLGTAKGDTRRQRPESSSALPITNNK